MDDAEDQDDSIGFEHVVHDAVVTHAQAVEGVGGAVQRLHRLALDSADPSRVPRKLLERANESRTNLWRELLERVRRGGAELDAIRVQVSSDRLTVRP